ncbi:Mismatch repair protein msh3 [Sporothrix stenoceras]|uniref:DNA mismatch repair protein n=1 Tax=Sporothrix stenoceras TaxID=5173 RepID=A0ABR3Z6Z6_9PEZI
MSTPRPSQKKQATLTSFFTPKSSGSNALPSSSPVQSQSQSSQPKFKSKSSQPPSQSLPSRKRPLEDEVDQNKRRRGNDTNGENGDTEKSTTVARSRFARAVKRARGESSDENEENEEDEDDGDDDFVPKVEKDDTVDDAPPKTTATTVVSPLRSSGRADRYIYDERRSQRTEKENGQSQEVDSSSSSDSDDAETKRKKAELHRKFVKKLGHPDSLTRLRRKGGDDEQKEDGEGEDGDDDDEEDRPKPASAAGKKKTPGKLTPGDQQFLAIKRKHLDTLLVVEVGYKFRIYGEDARTAARTLGIVCIPGKMRYDEHPSEAHLDRFASASFPVPRLPVHVKRLVAAGHKVGVVRQMETAALKKVGDNRNAPFVRQLTSVYTKGTYIDEASLGEEATTTTATTSAGYLLCLTEKSAGGIGTDEKVNVGLLAVQPATGDILYDSFEDGFMRNEIETRLLHIAPCELLLVGDLSRATEKLVQHLSGSASNVFGDRTRVERVAAGAQADAQTRVTQFYADSLAKMGRDESEKNDSDSTESRAKLLETVLSLPPPVTVCLSAMITHLTEYGLQHIFDLTKYFAAFSTRQHMLLNGTTLESLEVYRNATDHGLRGSLLWALDKTTTRPGHRLLRKWIGRPLLDRRPLEARVAAVEELLESDGAGRREKLELLLTSTRTTDLERSLIRIYYGKCTRPELVAVLQTLQRIASAYISTVSSTSAAAVEFSPNGFKSPLIRDALHSLPAIHDTVVSFLEKINGDAARKDDKYAFFRESEETDDIANYKVAILAVEMELEEHRAEIAETLNKKNKPAYVTVAGIEYLVEVLNTDIRRVPASWIKVSGTKKASRFHTPTVVRLIRERDQHKEALAAACDAAFAALLAELAACYQPLRDAVASLATLDCLLSLARVAAMPGYCKPTLLPTDDNTPASLDIQGGRHPVAEHTLPSGYIPFTAKLGGSGSRSDSDSTEAGPHALLITGPNMGGKSSFVRAVALLTLMAQIGSYVPADAMRLTLADAIFTRMGARDNLFAGESTFMVEVSETAAILRAATPRSLVVLDELGRGTSTHDGAAIAQAVLAHVATETKCLTLFITHYQNLGRVAEGLGPPRGVVQNVHMRFTATKPETSSELAKPARSRAGNEGDDSNADGDDSPTSADYVGSDGGAAEEITFLYEVGRGMAHRSYGLNVARLARIPQRVLDVAARKSREMEEDVRARRLQAAVRLAKDVLSAEAAETNTTIEDQLDHLISSIEQL